MVRIQKHIPEKPKGSNFDHSNCDFQWPTGIFSVLFKKYKLYNLIKKILYILNNNNNNKKYLNILSLQLFFTNFHILKSLHNNFIINIIRYMSLSI